MAVVIFRVIGGMVVMATDVDDFGINGGTVEMAVTAAFLGIY